MSRLDGREHPAGERGSHGRQQLPHHGIAGQRVAEPELLTLDREQLAANAAFQSDRHHAGGQPRRRRQQPPVEMTAKHGSHLQHPQLIAAQICQADPDRVRERAGHPG
jgi:hypothetical protein